MGKPQDDAGHTVITQGRDYQCPTGVTALPGPPPEDKDLDHTKWALHSPLSPVMASVWGHRARLWRLSF